MSSTAAVNIGPAYEQAQQALATLARTDFPAFAEFVLKDESTGGPVRLAPYHLEWSDLLDAHDRLLLLAHYESAKSSLLSVARTLFELGKNPNLRCAILSNAHGMAAKIVRSIARYIEQSPELRQVFPHLKAGSPWQHDAGFLTVQRPTMSKDPSVQAAGLHGSILGSRIDWLVVDDVIDFESTRTLEGRKRTAEWFSSTIVTRLSDTARVVCVGVPWHPEDLMAHLEASPRWASARYAVTDSAGKPRWPERWPLDRIARAREELGVKDSARQLDVVARDNSTATFKTEWIDAALARGTDKSLQNRFHASLGYRTVSGVDLAFGTKATNDLSAIATVLVAPDGRRTLIGLESGKWLAPDLLKRIIATYDRYGSRIVVESVAGQQMMVDMLRSSNAMIPVEGFKTGTGNRSLQYQAEQLAVEFEQGKWTLPAMANGRPTGEVAELVQDLLYRYSPGGHTPDRITALALARHSATIKKVQYGRLDLDRR